MMTLTLEFQDEIGISEDYFDDLKRLFQANSLAMLVYQERARRRVFDRCFSVRHVDQIFQFTCLYSRSFDPRNTGKISEEQFRKIMKSKETIEEEDVNDMIQGINVIFIISND